MRPSGLVLGLTALTSAISGVALGALLRLLFDAARSQGIVLPSAEQIAVVVAITALAGLVAWRFSSRHDYRADLAAYFSAPSPPPPPPARRRLASGQFVVLVVPFVGAAVIAAIVLSGVLVAGIAAAVATIVRLTITTVVLVVGARMDARQAERPARTKITPSRSE